MSQTSSFHNLTEDLIGKIILELSLTHAGSEEGLIPIYSLLGDLETLCEEQELWKPPVQEMLNILGNLLDEARGFDETTINQLNLFLQWAQETLCITNKGKTPNPPPCFTETQANGNSTEPGGAGSSEEEEQEVLGDELMIVPLSDDNDLLQEFYGEAVDHLEAIEAGVLVLEDSPQDQENLNNVFRAFHSLKGVSGFLHLAPIQKTAHEVEFLLDLARSEKLILNSSHITLILKSKDALQVLVDQVGLALNEGILPTDIVPVNQLIHSIQEAIAAGERGQSLVPTEAGSKEDSPEPDMEVASAESGFFSKMEVDPASQIPTGERPPSPPAEPTPTPATQAKKQITPATASKKPSGGGNSDYATIRVNTLKLDNLMDMVGELVIVESQLLESSKISRDSHDDNSPFHRNLSQLKRITKELQHTSMALRMVPVKPTFQKMGRIVRDLARNMGKEVLYTTKGEDTELDRNVIEQIGDPLMHMVRNALDHGFESKEQRLAAGKPAAGTLSLSAYHAGGNIVLELQDDGGGINAEKVFAKAVERGIVSQEQELSQRDIQNLIFQPGFSTADQVTEVSGRGVGMDVVRRNIESLRGTVEVASTPGEGSVFKIKLPLTMAIIDGLIVRAGRDRFILPTTSVRVAIRPKASELGKVQGRFEVVDFRGNSVPIVKLGNIFHLPEAVSNPEQGIVVILESFGKPIALLVDEMVGKQEVVIKNLGAIMGQIDGVSGGAILGDGEIALILDPPALSKFG